MPRRIVTDVNRMRREGGEHGFEIQQVEDNMDQYIGILPGLPDSMYADGEYKFVITFPEEYPFLPPTIKFITKIWHPNISHVDGTVCGVSGWTAAMGLFEVYMHIQCLMSTPEMSGITDTAAGDQFLNHQDLFRNVATFWHRKYGQVAGSMRDDQDDNQNNYQDCTELQKGLDEMLELGLEEDAAIRALSVANWNDYDALTNYFRRN